MKKRVLNAVRKTPGVRTGELAARFPSLTRPALQSILFDLWKEGAIRATLNYSASSDQDQGNHWYVVPRAQATPISFQLFERAYVKTHGQCRTASELKRFFNLARALGLRKFA